MILFREKEPREEDGKGRWLNKSGTGNVNTVNGGVDQRPFKPVSLNSLKESSSSTMAESESAKTHDCSQGLKKLHLR